MELINRLTESSLLQKLRGLEASPHQLQLDLHHWNVDVYVIGEVLGPKVQFNVLKLENFILIGRAERRGLGFFYFFFVDSIGSLPGVIYQRSPRYMTIFSNIHVLCTLSPSVHCRNTDKN